MSVNKCISTCSIIVFAVSSLCISLFKYNTIQQSISVSLMTGAIISFMSAEIIYLNERQKIFNKIKETIPAIYINLRQIYLLTGDILPQIIYVQQLDGLNYKRLLPMADLNMNFVQQCNINSFSCFFKRSKLSCAVQSFAEYTNCLYNLKACLGSLECAVLDADIIQNQVYLKQANNQMISLEENKLLQDKRNIVNIKTAKVHEYEASLLYQLDSVADQIFTKPKNIWKEQKKILDQEAVKIFNEV